MSKATAAWDRFITLIWSLLLMAAGAWAVTYYLQVPEVLDLTEYVNQRIWRESPTLPWFTPLLIAIMVVGLFLGFLLVWKNVTRHKIARVRSSTASADTGDIHFNVRDIAKAIAAELQQTPQVEQVKSVVAFDRGQPTVMYTVTCQPGVDFPLLRGRINRAETDLRDAIGQVEIYTTYRIHLRPIEH